MNPAPALAQAAALERAGRLASGVQALAEARMDAPSPSPADHALWVLAGELARTLDEARMAPAGGGTASVEPAAPSASAAASAGQVGSTGQDAR